MPKDKTLSHKRVLNAAKAEFLENGFEKASIRSIGERAGMTSAGLYRHCIDKEDLFCQILEPLMKEMNESLHFHKDKSDKALEAEAGQIEAFDNGSITIFRKLSLEYRDEMKLLLCNASGTRYENFLHDLVQTQEVEMFRALAALKAQGQTIMEVSDKQMHMLLSAYITAIMEPIIHDYTEEETEVCLSTVLEFFMPGWMKIMGF
ncbi:MAG: TetR/AcrR family transcriptional regulator [Lachnospiraceae bacterium]